MKQRYTLIKDISELSQLYKSAVSFAEKIALEKECELKVCVNNKESCSQYIEKAFGEAGFRKLKNGSVLDGRNVSLFSIATLRKNFPLQDAVYLAFFPTGELLDIIESSEGDATIIVISEEGYIPSEIQCWIDKNVPDSLGPT